MKRIITVFFATLTSMLVVLPLSAQALKPIPNYPGAERLSEKRYDWGVELAAISNESGDFMLNLRGVYGYKFSPWFKMGLGAGLAVPVAVLSGGMEYFLRLEANFPAGKVAPFISFDAGGFTWFWNTPSFFMYINPTAGLAFRLRKGNLITAGLGYHHMWRHISIHKYYANSLFFRVGYKF